MPRTRYFLVSTLLLLCLCSACAEQEQSLSVSADQLGNISGAVFFSARNGEFSVGDVFDDGLSCQIVGETGMRPCTSSPEIRVRLEAVSPSEACDEDARCQNSGSDTVDRDGTYSVSNLVVGNYRLEAEYYSNLSSPYNDQENCYLEGVGAFVVRVNDEETTQNVSTNTTADIVMGISCHGSPQGTDCRGDAIECELSN